MPTPLILNGALNLDAGPITGTGTIRCTDVNSTDNDSPKIIRVG